jgi:hypothetical protein
MSQNFSPQEFPSINFTSLNEHPEIYFRFDCVFKQIDDQVGIFLGAPYIKNQDEEQANGT